MFQYFGTANKNFSQKSLLYQLFHLLRIERNPDPANDADPTRSRSTTLLVSVPAYVVFAIHILNPPPPPNITRIIELKLYNLNSMYFDMFIMDK
jgi:hypothetical protein